MLPSLPLTFICSLIILNAVNAAIPGYTQLGSQTRLLGSSFGLPGTNATFDYVVS